MRDDWPAWCRPLHHACAHGASKCARLLVQHRPRVVNDLDCEQCSPLLKAAPWGQPLIQDLIEAGESAARDVT